MPLASCPPSFELEQFLLGRLEDVDSEKFEAHLSTCTNCQKQLTTLVAEDEFVQAIRTHATNAAAETKSHLENPSEDLVKLLVPHFKQIANALEETGSFASNPATVGISQSSDLVQGRISGEATSLPQLGHYEIRGILGQGGMGTVLHAVDPMLKRSIAIKVIHSKLVADPTMASRLVREAQAAAAVEHDNIVAIYAVETHDGSPCIMMPLLRGKSLKQSLEEQPGPCELTETLRIGRESACGLAAAHAAGLIHCDIKPANLWLEAPHDRVKILDFGLAIVRDDSESDTEFICGTPGFLAPEQARGLPLDQRTDIFSLGCVLYLMATGRAPFTGERRLRSLWTVLSNAPTPAVELNPELPIEFSELIDQMLARDPNQRPASAAKIVEAIEACERRIVERQHKVVRRRWLAAMTMVALCSGSGVSLWSLMNTHPTELPVKTTLIGDLPPLAIIIRREGQEQNVTLGREKTLELSPGDYTIRPVADQPGRTLIPDHFSVEPDKPLSLRIALVGEIVNHTTHTQAVTSIAVLPEIDQRIYSAGLDRVVAAWEPSSTVEPRFGDLPHAVRCVALSPRGDQIATAGGNKQIPVELEIRILNANTFEPLGEPLAGHSRLVTVLAYSPDGTQLASAGADGLFVWDLRQGKFESFDQPEPHTILSLAYSSDGKQLLSGDDAGQIILWDLQTRASITMIAASESPVRTVAFLEKRWIASGDDGIIRIWHEGDLLHEWIGHKRAVLALAVSPDGRQVVSGDADGIVRVWSVSTGQTSHVLKASSDAVNAVAITGSGRQAVTGGADGVVRLWQLPFSD